MLEYKSRLDELPEPSPCLVLWRTSMEAFLATAGPKRGEAFLFKMGEILATEDTVSNILPIRPDTEAERVQRARREAVAIFRQYLPVLLARLNGRG